jgi:hypothetical protein
MIRVIVNNKQQLDSIDEKERKIEGKERNRKRKPFSSTLMCFNEDGRISLVVIAIFPSLSLSVSPISSGPSLTLSLDYPIDCKYILWRISKCVVHSSRKKSTAQGKRQRERKKREETTYDTILQKKQRKKRTRHTSASSTIIALLFADYRDTPTSKTMTWPLSYVRNNEITYE